MNTNNSTALIQLFLSIFAMYLPTMIVCLVACVVILAKWRQASSASLWALLGFGLLLVLCFASPIGMVILQPWLNQGGQLQSHVWVYSAFSMVLSVLHCVAYVFLLVAIFAGRSKAGAAMPPPITGR